MLNSFNVKWSREDQEFVGLCKNYPSLSYLDKDFAKSLKGIINLVGLVETEKK